MADTAQQKKFLNSVIPSWQKYGKQYGFTIISFAIAQSCYESGWGESYDAVNLHNVLGIGPHKRFSSWDECIKGYYTLTVLGRSSEAKNAKTLDQYHQAFKNSHYLGNDDTSGYYSAVKAIIKSHNLEKYDNGGGGGDSGVNKCEEFVQKALSYKGTNGGGWAAKHPNWYHPGVWCADFVSVCGEEVGITGKVFDMSPSAYACAHSVEKYGGTVHNEKSYSPQRGDLINFMWNGGAISGGYADHIGIVTELKDGTVHTIEGNSGDVVKTCSYPRSSSVLACFCTPDWEKVGGLSGGSSGGGFVGDLFSDLNTREDAILREAAYLKPIYEPKNKKKIKEYEPTEKPTAIKLSIVNYTELFQTFWEIGAPSASSSESDISGEYDYSKLDSKVRNVIKYLVDKGLNNAGACGVAGNIYYESSFDTAAIGDNGTSFGICQWHYERGDAMKRMAGANWSNNMSGQLDYLWYELENSYGSLLSALKGVQNSASGAKNAADMFCRQFERPANVDAKSIQRQGKAEEYFSQITQIVTNKDGSGNSKFNSVNLKNLSGNRKKYVERAYQECGKPYQWGAVGPGSYDCSGLVSYCLSGQHIRLGTTGTFMGWPQTSSPQPGDVCVNSGHCGLYIGDNKMIHAPCDGEVVKEGNVQAGMIFVMYQG